MNVIATLSIDFKVADCVIIFFLCINLQWSVDAGFSSGVVGEGFECSKRRVDSAAVVESERQQRSDRVVEDSRDAAERQGSLLSDCNYDAAIDSINLIILCCRCYVLNVYGNSSNVSYCIYGNSLVVSVSNSVTTTAV